MHWLFFGKFFVVYSNFQPGTHTKVDTNWQCIPRKFWSTIIATISLIHGLHIYMFTF